MTDNIINKDQIMISLLGRLAYPEDRLKEIITRNKRNPNAYIRGYNSCDGKSNVSEIAKVIGVSQPTITPILKEWKNIGIIFEAESLKGGKTYMKLYPLPNPKEKTALIQNTQESPEISEIQTQTSLDMGEQNGE